MWKRSKIEVIKDVLILFALLEIAAIVSPQSGFLSINAGRQFAIVLIVGLILGTLVEWRRATSGFVVFI